MNELRLVFEKTNDAHTVRFESSWGGAGKSVSFESFLTEDDHENLRWYLEEFMDLPDDTGFIDPRLTTPSMLDVCNPPWACWRPAAGVRWPRSMSAGLSRCVWSRRRNNTASSIRRPYSRLGHIFRGRKHVSCEVDNREFQVFWQR